MWPGPRVRRSAIAAAVGCAIAGGLAGVLVIGPFGSLLLLAIVFCLVWPAAMVVRSVAVESSYGPPLLVALVAAGGVLALPGVIRLLTWGAAGWLVAICFATIAVVVDLLRRNRPQPPDLFDNLPPGLRPSADDPPERHPADKPTSADGPNSPRPPKKSGLSDSGAPNPDVAGSDLPGTGSGSGRSGSGRPGSGGAGSGASGADSLAGGVGDAGMSVEELCRVWRESGIALRRTSDPHERETVAEVRRLCLNELERLNPEGFRRWLDAGAPADPGAFLLRKSE
ncbi:hypothetical protein OG394_21310 [Kribbella sp. NBC_01245]|uniref:hypothetical protein n=1 Tax=Kribbella sp. NBC_01245 TaxID=2903578 RepID=UPI002E2C0121|nr:hypothetical protein [Kribbella sp. NBC_01245]